MRLAIHNGPMAIDGGIVEGRAVIVEQGRIAAIVDAADLPGDIPRHDLDGLMLAPGFIDTQVNGGGGVLFNDAPTVETIATIAAAHRRFGTTGLFPTLISDDLAVVRAGVAAVDAAILAGVPGILGIHIEGPFLNAERRGIHDAARLRELDEDGMATVTGLRHGRTLLTLAPEMTTSRMIARLAAAGIVVAAGHTAATYAEARQALDHGLTGFTHLFNAMSQLGNREPGVVGAALEDDASWCCMIVDGHHVAPATLKLALRCKAAAKFVLVTDAMPSVGTDVGSFVLQGKVITVDGDVCVDADGTLAGAHLNMAAAVRNAVRLLSLPPVTALEMASTNPAAYMGLSATRGRIATGLQADLVALDPSLQVVGSWIGGDYASSAR
ncbi:N-acetylglucosamine-6-phosphate deacetylase [Glacieibacterium sp.]|uniref:N-acetylglucosamine-6-phosphate deacetylase n=1 Tax=Glacieibacterium sp. TaxID=2860237 RepID=UPI003B00C24E